MAAASPRASASPSATATATPRSKSVPTIDSNPAATRRDSAVSTPQQKSSSSSSSSSTAKVRTRSLGYGACVAYERDLPPPTDDDLIIVTVRLRNSFRKSSVDGARDLPSRPAPRSFLRRLSTRLTSTWDHSAEKAERYKVMKMPRRDYKKFFARDADGQYAGTEPEREWDEEELGREFGAYQDVPLHSVVG